MGNYTYFNIIKANKDLLNRLQGVMHIQTSHDGYSLLKKEKWNIIYIDPKDFHDQIDHELKIFFEYFFGEKLFIVDLPFNLKNDDIDLLNVESFSDFINLWDYYTIENYNSGKYSSVDNKDFIIEQFFFSTNMGIFNDKLDWVFCNDIDTYFSAILYSDDIKGRVENIFKNYSEKITVEDIRVDIPNFATNNWF